MRPWIIVLSSAVAAIAAAAVIARPELSAAAPSDIARNLLPHLPVLAVAMLAVYALGAVILTSGGLVAGVLRLRRELARAPSYAAAAALPLDWIAAFDATGLRWLAPLPGRLARVGGSLPAQCRVSPQEARVQTARLHYIGLARTHFFSALIGLAAIVSLGLAQSREPLPFLPGTVPTLPAVLILVGLLLLALLSRLAIDVTIEPLIEAVSRFPADPAEVGLLRRAVELLEAPRPAAAASAEGIPTATPEFPARLVDVLEEGQRALVDAIGRMSATTDALGATTRSSVEALEATLRRTTPRHQPGGEAGIAEAAGMTKLQTAVESLTAALERVAALAGAAEHAPSDADPAAGRWAPEPQLARELRQLLREIEPAP